jgi:chorismate dehydratase
VENTDPNPVTMLKDHDAALIIGDPAFGLRSMFPNHQVYDLSAQWFEQTRKTFVHAVVAVGEETQLMGEFIVKVQEAKMEGKSRLESIARTTSNQSGIAFETCYDYLSKKIIYDLGEEEMIGLRHFRDVCFEKGILGKSQMIRFVQV